MVKTLILLRGIPGSGKSTVATALMRMFPNAEHYEADQYWMKDGEYKFKPEELGLAHDWCHQKVSNALKARVETVIVANTFVKLWEMQEYLREALAYGYNLQVIDCQSTFTDIHEVPTNTLERMYQQKEVFDMKQFLKENINA